MLQQDEASYQSGVAAAERDIASGHLRLRYGARGAWGEDLARTLQTRFGVELIVLSCFSSDATLSFEAGYNKTVEAHIDDLWGHGSLAAVWVEIQGRREEHSDSWNASTQHADEE